MIKKLFILFNILFISCLNVSNKVFDPQKEIHGHWLILYPKHVLKDDAQRKIYGKAQDSIVNLMGLKLISFNSNGDFIQTDSLYGDHGRWTVADTGHLEIHSGGKGFEKFDGAVVGIVNDTILIEQIVMLNEENIKLIWHLKKVKNTDEAALLFEEKDNLWRKRPVKKETEKEIKDRVAAMLKYYALYFKVVSRESIYFSPARVVLPFTYFQHGIGLKTFEMHFINYFFDTDDAEKGYQLLKQAFELTKNDDFPNGENFVIEYSKYFQKLSGVIR